MLIHNQNNQFNRNNLKCPQKGGREREREREIEMQKLDKYFFKFFRLKIFLNRSGRPTINPVERDTN